MKSLFILLSTIITISSLKGVEISKSKEFIKIKNSVYTLTISPQQGGRVIAWENNKSGKNYCYWDPSGNHSGLLDDKGAFTGMPYSVNIQENSSNLAKICLTSKNSSGGLTISKIITVRHNQSKLDVTYEYINNSPKVYINSMMIRNYFLPGGKASTNLRYFISNEKGVQTWKYPYKNLEKWFKKLSSNWFALINESNKSGIALVVNSYRLRAFYGFMARKNPTMEWMCKIKVQPKSSVKIPVSIIMLQKAGNVAFACPEAVAYADYKITKNKLKAKTGIEPVAEVYEQAEPLQGKLQLDYLANSKRNTTGMKRTITFPCPVWVGQLSETSTMFPLAKQGTYALKTKLLAGHREIGEWEQPFDFGKPTSEYYMGKAMNKKVIKIMHLDEKDKTKGYGIHFGGLTMPYKTGRSINLNLGTGESEAFEIGLTAIKNIGQVTVDVKTNSKLNSKNLKFYQLKKVKDKYEDTKALFPFKKFIVHKGNDIRLWAILNCTGLKPGKYDFKIAIKPESAPSTTIPVSLNIWDVKRANRDNADLTMWHLLSWNLNFIGRKFAEDMKAHGVGELRIAWHNRFWRDKVKLTLREDGKLKTNFKGTKKYLRIARNAGMNKIAIMYRLINSSWFKSLGKISPTKRKKYERIVVRDMVDFLLSMGFERIEYFCMDEPPTTVGKSISQKMLEFKSIHPLLRIATTINHMSNKMLAELAPGIDVWYMSCFTASPVIEMIKQKKIDLGKDDDIRIYYAFARVYSKPYDILRSKGWYSGWLQLKCYGIYNYLKPSLRPDRIVFRDKHKNILTTPAWEGVRDGFDDFVYLRRLQVLYSKLLNSKHDAKSQAKLKQVEKFLKDAFQNKKTDKSILIKKTYRYGYNFYKMEEPGRHRILKIRESLMPLLADLEALNKAAGRK